MSFINKAYNAFKRMPLLFARMIDIVLQLIIPVKNTRICYTSSPDYSDNSYHLFRYALQTRNDLEHIWLLRDTTSLSNRIKQDFATVTGAARTKGHHLIIAKRQSLRGYFLYLTSKHVFHTHGIYKFPKNSIKRNIVSLWHGMPIKRVGQLIRPKPDPFPSFGTVHIATSDLFRFIIAASFNAKPDDVLICLPPRCDALIYETSRSCTHSDVRARLNLSVETKILLWMPTFRTEPEGSPFSSGREPTYSFIDDIQPEILAALLHAASENNVTIVIKLHPVDRLNEDCIFPNHQNVLLLKADSLLQLNIPVYDLVASSDALLSDISSILIDYLATSRPIGIFPVNLTTYARGTNFSLESLLTIRRYQILNSSSACVAFIKSIGIKQDESAASRNINHLFMQSFKKPGSEMILSHLDI